MHIYLFDVINVYASLEVYLKTFSVLNLVLYTSKTMITTRTLFCTWLCLYASLPDVWNVHGFSPITLRTSSGTINNGNGKEVLDFLATPSNWPKIVLSSSDVERIAPTDVNQPLRPGNRVAEIFGLPPLLPLSVEWVCRSNTYPVLDVVSSNGVTGIASDCRMLFIVRDVVAKATSQSDDVSAVVVDLEMSFTPSSLLAVMVVPLLVLDNTLALKGLLPRAINDMFNDRAAQSNSQSIDRAVLTKPLDEFRALMGELLLYKCIKMHRNTRTHLILTLTPTSTSTS